jgi:hypothetical protein
MIRRNSRLTRYYNSQVGRFHTPDPDASSPRLKRPQSWNRYAYVEGQPVNAFDPDGRKLLIIGQDCQSFDVFEEFEIFCFDVSVDVEAPYYPAPTPGGGGNSNAAFSAAQAAFKRVAADLSKKTFSKNCERDLAALKVTDSQVHNGAGSAVFLNGVGNQTPLKNLYATSPVAGVRQAGLSLTGTVGSFITSNPGTVAVAQLGGNDIYLNSSLINPSDYYTDAATALHEILHNITGLTDPDIQRLLGLPETNVSNNKTQKLLKDCF